MSRIEFSAPVKRALAERAGFRCSFPECNAPTIGPSEEAPTAVNRSGTACHIYAASDGRGARRVPQGMEDEDRGSIDNGIWMCARHGDLIDGDEERYPAEMLIAWRALAESKAKLRQETGREIAFHSLTSAGVRLVRQEIRFYGLGAENQMIGDALLYSCAYDLWGRQNTQAVRDLLIELIRNAFSHGGATIATLSIEPTRVVLTDDGNAFAVDALLGHPVGRGGSAAIHELLVVPNSQAVITSRRDNNHNDTIVAFVTSATQIVEVTPCALTMTVGAMSAQAINIEELSSCESVYIIPPPYIAFSDIVVVIRRVAEARARKRITLVLEDVSDGVARMIAEDLPGIRILRF